MFVRGWACVHACMCARRRYVCVWFSSISSYLYLQDRSRLVFQTEMIACIFAQILIAFEKKNPTRV